MNAMKKIPIILSCLFLQLLAANDNVMSRIPSLDKLGDIARWMSKPPSPKAVHEQMEFNMKRYVHHKRKPSPPVFIGHETNPIEDQNCFAINFGWPEELTVPFLTLSFSMFNPDDELLRISVPSGCFLVMVGGKYIPQMNDIVEKVEALSEHLSIKPLIYFAEKTEHVISATTTHVAMALIPKQTETDTHRVEFEVHCPVYHLKVYDPLLLFNNGSVHTRVHSNLNFKNMCPLKQRERVARIAFDQGWYLQVNLRTNYLFEWNIWWTLVNSGSRSKIPYYDEIYKLFFTIYHVAPIWTDNKGEYNKFHNVTKEWSGYVGKVGFPNNLHFHI